MHAVKGCRARTVETLSWYLSLLAASSFHFMSPHCEQNYCQRSHTYSRHTYCTFWWKEFIVRVSKQLDYTLRCVDRGSLWIQLAPLTPELTITETLYFSCHVMLMPIKRVQLLREKNDCNYTESLEREQMWGERCKRRVCVCVCSIGACSIEHITQCF